MIILGLFCDYFGVILGHDCFKCYFVNNWGNIRVILRLYWGAESESNGGSRCRVSGLKS